MPESTDQAADATKASSPAGTESQTPEAEATELKKLDLTQEQFDAIIADRIKRAQPKDYSDLQAKAARLSAIEEAKKTDAQKADDEKREALTAANAKLALADQRLRSAAIVNEAAKQNAVNPATVARLLADDEGITVNDDGAVSGVESAVKKLLKDEPYMAKGQAQTSGGEFGGTSTQTLDEKISAAEAARDYKTATQLKIQKGLNIA
ncbi:MAG: hypothetical protein H0V97_08990 [Actinobacteria bacterium]|nr:hypothetical protein [Actinomycetota bacterium]